MQYAYKVQFTTTGPAQVICGNMDPTTTYHHTILIIAESMQEALDEFNEYSDNLRENDPKVISVSEPTSIEWMSGCETVIVAE